MGAHDPRRYSGAGLESRPSLNNQRLMKYGYQQQNYYYNYGGYSNYFIPITTRINAGLWCGLKRARSRVLLP